MTDASRTSPDLAELSDLAPMLADVLGLLSSDIALVLDASGVIHKVVLGSTDTEGFRAASADWVGRALQDTATDCTRGKVDALLRDLSSEGVSRPRHINHPGPDGEDIPVTYTAVRLGRQGPLLAIGRDLRAIRAMQQRLVESQQEMERSYWKLRQVGSTSRGAAGGTGPAGADSRILALVERTQDAVVITDEGGYVLAANPAFASLLELDAIPAAEGQPLSRWLGAAEGIVVRTIAALHRDGTLPVFATGLHTERGRRLRVEISVTLLPGETAPCVGFILRAQAQRSADLPHDRTGDEPAGSFH